MVWMIAAAAYATPWDQSSGGHMIVHNKDNPNAAESILIEQCKSVAERAGPRPAVASQALPQQAVTLTS